MHSAKNSGTEQGALVGTVLDPNLNVYYLMHTWFTGEESKG